MRQSKDISPLAWVLLALLGLIWGGSFLSIRIALNEVGFLTSVAHRTGWAMCLLWLYVWYLRPTHPKRTAHMGRISWHGLAEQRYSVFANGMGTAYD